MGKYFVNITQDARKHIALIHKSGEKSAIKRIEQILLELSERPEVG